MAVRNLTAREAAALLGVTLPTLYAYTSRGLLRSEPVPGEPRSRRYPEEEVTRLRNKRELRRDPAKAVEQGLHWGGPVLESAITQIDGGRLKYRGRDAVELAGRASVEEVAALLWTGGESQAEALFSLPRPHFPRGLVSLLFRTREFVGPVERCQIVLPFAGAADVRAFDLRPAAVAATGARILRLLAAVAVGRSPKATIAGTLQAAWAPERPESARALSAALIACADHELNVSAFTVRCVASSAATPYECVSAGLAALKGKRHGGGASRVEALLREVGTSGRAEETLAGRLRRGEELPGFGHPLYPEGDPRARVLLDLAAELAPASPTLALAREVGETACALTGDPPNLDFGLATLATTLALPEGGALALFALGRTMGWIAHAIEQYADPRLIRPRARYTGPPPQGT
jgi:citrate synthase